jgi:long-chain fatty acid transport protein
VRIVAKFFLGTVVLAGACSSAQAVLFQQWNMDAAGLGDSQAGQAAGAEDASTAFYNPAGLVRFDHQQAVMGLNGSFPDIQFTPPSGASAQGAQSSAWPYVHYVAPISKQWFFGFSTSSPFAMRSNWSTDSGLGGAATKTSFRTYDISTDLAYAVNNRWSFALGYDAVRILMSADNTSSNERNGHDWANAWHGGALYQLDESNRIGLAYHSRIDMHLAGTSADYTTGDVDDLAVNGSLPAYTVLSLYHAFNKTWTALASLKQTQWNQMNTMSDTDNAGVLSDDLSYQNTAGVDLGVHYRLNDAVTFKAGGGYESSPLNDKDTVYIRCPNDEAYHLNVGLHAMINATLSFDVAWMHYFYPDKNITVSIDDVGGSSTGSLTRTNDVLGAQVVWNM